jgi:hypothetical protein
VTFAIHGAGGFSVALGNSPGTRIASSNRRAGGGTFRVDVDIGRVAFRVGVNDAASANTSEEDGVVAQLDDQTAIAAGAQGALGALSRYFVCVQLAPTAATPAEAAALAAMGGAGHTYAYGRDGHTYLTWRDSSSPPLDPMYFGFAAHSDILEVRARLLRFGKDRSAASLSLISLGGGGSL